MERLTKHYKDSDGYYKKCSEACHEKYCKRCALNGEPIYRLGQIEDILGDTYDLDRLEVMMTQCMSMREEVYERFRITGSIPVDRLRELVEADKDGRCVVMPCKDWLGIVFGDQEVFYGIDKDYEENPIREISVDSSSRCTWYNGWESVVLKGYDENGFDWEFSPEDIGKTVFLTREAAEAALAKEADHE